MDNSTNTILHTKDTRTGEISEVSAMDLNQETGVLNATISTQSGVGVRLTKQEDGSYSNEGFVLLDDNNEVIIIDETVDKTVDDTATLENTLENTEVTTGEFTPETIETTDEVTTDETIQTIQETPTDVPTDGVMGGVTAPTAFVNDTADQV